MSAREIDRLTNPFFTALRSRRARFFARSAASTRPKRLAPKSRSNTPSVGVTRRFRRLRSTWKTPASCIAATTDPARSRM